MAILKGTIIVVDDFPGVAKSLAVRLRIQGYEVETASDGAKAIELIDKLEPNLALIDLDLPVINGYGVARRVRQSKDGDAILLVAISGWLDQTTVDLALDSGFDLAIAKPIDDDAMNGILDRLAIRMQNISESSP